MHACVCVQLFVCVHVCVWCVYSTLFWITYTHTQDSKFPSGSTNCVCTLCILTEEPFIGQSVYIHVHICVHVCVPHYFVAVLSGMCL